MRISKVSFFGICTSQPVNNPSYIVVSEDSPQHNRTFTIKVMIGEVEYGIGKGKNKKSAEQNAANSALVKIASPND